MVGLQTRGIKSRRWWRRQRGRLLGGFQIRSGLPDQIAVRRGQSGQAITQNFQVLHDRGKVGREAFGAGAVRPGLRNGREQITQFLGGWYEFPPDAGDAGRPVGDLSWLPQRDNPVDVLMAVADVIVHAGWVVDPRGSSNPSKAVAIAAHRAVASSSAVR